MNRSTPWGTDRFNPDPSLLSNASMAKKLVEEHKLNDSNLKQGLQEFVDATGEQAMAAADVVRAVTEGEVAKAEDRRELNEVERQDRQSLTQDIRIHSTLSHEIRNQVNRGLFNEAKTLDMANQSHEMANELMGEALVLQRVDTNEQIDSIRSQVEQRIASAKSKAIEEAKDRLRALRERKVLTYQKVTEGNGQMVDAKLGVPSTLIDTTD